MSRRRTLTVFGVLLCLSAWAEDAPLTTKEVAELEKRIEPPVTCPSSVKAWRDWRDESLKNLNIPEDLGPLAHQLSVCAGRADQRTYFDDPHFAMCMNRLRSVGAMFTRFADEGVYNLVAPGVQTAPFHVGTVTEKLPEIFRDPDFVRDMNSKSKEVRDGAIRRAAAAIPGVKSFGYVSNTSGRYVAVLAIPGEKYDQMIHFDTERNGPSPLVMSIKKVDDNGDALDPPRINFAEYEVKLDTQADPQTVEVKKSERPDHYVRCYECHRTGIMPVVARAGSDPVVSYTQSLKAEKALSWFNEEVAGDNPIAVSPAIKMSRLPAALGDVDPPTRDLKFLKSCSGKSGGSMSDQRLVEIGQQMNCQNCHDGETHGKLTFPFGPHDFKGFLEGMITSGHMPPGNTLSAEERKVLLRCLKYEYFGGFSDPELGGGPQAGSILRDLTTIPCPTSIAPQESQSGVKQKSLPPQDGADSDAESSRALPAH